MTIMNIKVTFGEFYCRNHDCWSLSTYVRYLHGLGAVSNMNDQYPWGLWIALIASAASWWRPVASA